MELEDVQSDLHSLRKLYGLLLTIGDGLQTTKSENAKRMSFVAQGKSNLQKFIHVALRIEELESVIDKNLDEKARLLLKNLLDCATARVFETCSKIIAGQSDGLNMPLCTQSELPKGIQRSKPSVPRNTSNISQYVAQSMSKDLSFSESSQKNKQSTKNPIPHACEYEKRKKYYELHEQSSMKQQIFAQKMQISNGKVVPTKGVNNQVQFGHYNRSAGDAKGLDSSKEKSAEPLRGHEMTRQKRYREVLQCDSKDPELLAASSRILASGVEGSLGTEAQKKPADVDNIAKEVADTIKRIDSYLPVVQLITDPVDQGGGRNTAQLRLCEKKLNSIPIAESDSPTIIARNSGLVSRTERSEGGYLGLTQNDLPSQQQTQKLRKTNYSSMQHLVMTPRSHKFPSEGLDLLGLNSGHKLPNWGGIETFQPLQKSYCQLDRLVSRKGVESKRSNFSFGMQCPTQSPSMGVTNPPSQKMTLISGRNVKAVVEKSESVNQLASQNDPVASAVSDTIQGFRIPNHKFNVKETPVPVKVNQIHKEIRDNNLVPRKGIIRKGVTSRALVTPQSVGTAKRIQAANANQKLSRTGTREMISTEKNLRPQMIVRPTLLDYCPSQKSLLPRASYTDQTDIKGSGKQKHSYVSPRRRVMQPHQEESEVTKSSSCSSSSWRTQQTSSESRGEGSLPDQAPSLCRILGHAATDSNMSEEECSDSSISPQQYEPGDSSSRMRGIRKYRSGYAVKSQKAVGRLRRLRNKLGIIFHHHHHHHHHHHKNEEDTEEAGGHSRSLWSYVQKMIHPSSKEEVVCQEEVEEKFRRSAVINAAPHKQQGRHHFRAMVEGLLRHIRNSKKSSKAGRGGMKLIESRGVHGNDKKRSGKKLQRWQQATGTRGGLKLPKASRVKLGFKSKKSQLKGC